jgi:hypothetical protein
VITDAEVFEIASNAFNLFTAQERLSALKVFASLKYPKVEDRFSEAVYRVISADRSAAKAECSGCGCSRALCLEYKLHGAIACCPDCQHGNAPEASPR